MIELNTIYNEDCLLGMKRIGDKSIDMILCDLPYGTTQCKWDTIIPFDVLWNQYERIIKDDGAIVLTASEPFTSYLVVSNIKLFKYDIIWQKTHPKGHLNAKKMPMRAHENILVFYKKTPTYNPQKTFGHHRKVAKTNYIKESDGESVYGKEIRNTSYDSTDRYPLSVQVFSNGDMIKTYHPTQKPVALFKWLIETYTNDGEIVMDNCMGGGTTAIAALLSKRNYIGFEMDKEYFNIATERIKSFENKLKQELFT